MIQKEYFIKRQDTPKSEPIALSVLSVSPDFPNTAKFVVQIIHGLCDRKERYLPLMKAVAEAGGMAVIHDLRGYGNTVRSKDELGDFGDYGYNYDLLCDDIDSVYASISEYPADGELIECRFDPETDTPDVPRYLLGFSSGALIASIYLSRRTSSIAGALLSGLPHRERTIGAKLFWLNLMSIFTGESAKPKFLYKKMTRRYSNIFLTNTDSEARFLWYSADPVNRDDLIRDPVCNHAKTVGSHVNLCRLLRDTYRPSTWDKPRKNLPVLIMAGEFDPEAGGDKSVLYAAKFLDDMGFSSVDIKMYRGMRHEIFRDIGRENVFADVIAFCEKYSDTENERLNTLRSEYTSVFSGSADASDSAEADKSGGTAEQHEASEPSGPRNVN